MTQLPKIERPEELAREVLRAFGINYALHPEALARGVIALAADRRAIVEGVREQMRLWQHGPIPTTDSLLAKLYATEED